MPFGPIRIQPALSLTSPGIADNQPSMEVGVGGGGDLGAISGVSEVVCRTIKDWPQLGAARGRGAGLTGCCLILEADPLMKGTVELA